jgi:hypothetical protein
LANKPIQKVDKEAIAAVAVIRSRLISFEHNAYSVLFAHIGSSAPPLQTHVPPVSATILALTAMIYAMAKKVANPARISVKKLHGDVSPATDPKMLHSRTFRNIKHGNPRQEKSELTGIRVASFCGRCHRAGTSTRQGSGRLCR